MKKAMAALLPAAVLACGCFTVKQTRPESVRFAGPPEGRDAKVAVTGFEATVTEYLPVYGHQTVYVDRGPWHSRRGRRVWSGGHYETLTTETHVPHVRASGAFLERARMHLEDAGYVVMGKEPEYAVDVAFAGPYATDADVAKETAWMFLSLLTAEYSTQTWSAKLRVYDAKSGRVLHSKEFRQKYEHCVWSPIPIIGLSGCTENTYNYMQNWCLCALTDKAVEEAASFLSKRFGAGAAAAKQVL